jgi:hypothetical protein
MLEDIEMAQDTNWWKGLSQRIIPAAETSALRGKFAQGVHFLKQHPRMSGLIVGSLVLSLVYFCMGPQNVNNAVVTPASSKVDPFSDIDLELSDAGDTIFAGGFHDGLDNETTANSQANIPTSVEVPRLFSPLADSPNETSVQPASFQSETGPAWLTGTIEADETPARRTQIATPNIPFGQPR